MKVELGVSLGMCRSVDVVDLPDNYTDEEIASELENHVWNHVDHWWKKADEGKESAR